MKQVEVAQRHRERKGEKHTILSLFKIQSVFFGAICGQNPQSGWAAPAVLSGVMCDPTDETNFEKAIRMTV